MAGVPPWSVGLGAEESLGLWSLLAGALLIVVNIILSIQLSLGLHTTFIVATVRCIVQLTILAYILAPAFALNRWWLLLIYFAVMVVISSIETVSRPPAAYEGMLMHVLLAMSGSSALVLAFSILLVLRPRPWYDARILLPAVGILLSNTISGVSLGLSAALQELTAGRERVESLLSIGASRMEATKGVIQRSIVTALTPALNQMSVVGLVSLPEFLSGQLAAGASTYQAARFQIVIILLAITTAALASTAAVFAAMLVAVDGQHRLRSERLISRHGRESGVAQWVHAQAIKGWNAARRRSHRIVSRLRVVMAQRASRQRGQSQGSHSWIMQSPLAQRVFGRRPPQDEEYDEMGSSLDSRLRGAVLGASDDEQESIFSGALSEPEDGLARGAFSVGDDNRLRGTLPSPLRSEHG